MKLNADRSVDTSITYRNSDEGKKLQVMTNGVKDYYFNNGDPVALEAGEYILYVNAYDKIDTMFNSLTLTPEGWKEEIPASDIFGDTYAYVKDSKVYFIGGLKTIDGSAVGFDVSINDGESFEATTDKVYKSLSVGTSITKSAADFGVGEDGYIFITETDKLEKGNIVKIKPFIVKNGQKVYHGELELSLKI